MVVPVVQGPPIGLGNVNPDFHPDCTPTTTTTEACSCFDSGTNCNGDPCGPWPLDTGQYFLNDQLIA